MPPTSTIRKLDTALTEGTDYEVVATIVGPDGSTGVEPAAISTLTAKMISLEPGGGVIFEGEDVKSHVSSGGAFAMPLAAEHITAPGSGRFQKRLLLLELVQTNNKRHVQPIELFVENVPGL